MRSIFFIILTANMVLLLWSTQIQSSYNNAKTPPSRKASKQLVLVKEHISPELSSVAEAAEPQTEIPDIEVVDENQAEPEKSQCYTIGPFKDLDDAKKVAEQIEKQDIEVRRRGKGEREQYGYKVYLRPYSTYEEAVAVAKLLDEKGVKDYYVMADGDKKNGIALGLFRNKSGAIRRMSEVRRLRYKPSLEISYRESTVFWLDYAQTAKEKTAMSFIWASAAQQYANLQRLDRNCAVALK